MPYLTENLQDLQARRDYYSYFFISELSNNQEF